MAVYKCKACGNIVEISVSESIRFCGNCGASSENFVELNGGNDLTPLLKRAFMFLEDGEWENADEYCERILDADPENASAYLGKLMAKLNAKTPEELSKSTVSFENMPEYKKILRFGDEILKAELLGIIDEIHENKRAESEKIRAQSIEHVYKAAMEQMEKDSIQGYIEARKLLKGIEDYKDSREKIEECNQKTELILNATYEKALNELSKNELSAFEKAQDIFESIKDYKDSKEKVEECKEKIKIRQKSIVYLNALAEMRKEEIPAYEEAIRLFKTIEDYENSNRMIEECKREIEKLNKQFFWDVRSTVAFFVIAIILFVLLLVKIFL